MKRYLLVFGIAALPIIATNYPDVRNAEEAGAPSIMASSVVAQQDTLLPQQGKSEIPTVITSPSSAGEVVFPHQQHIKELQINCKVCHHETNAAELKFPHNNYFDDFWIDCKICHHEKGTVKLKAQACSKCHRTLPKDIADETLSAKVVIHKNCWECHPAENGAAASQNCKFCHSGPRTKF
ncbi:MAG: hypothetical protein ONB44_12885 [candidate division KSB1 bacterium]|nr:hypothetical protein [candidate division KSB1 bacterium]MDZ7303015.1 hypothetical protein [candidate division KSB1 bacterium]MDZ7312477.1 hypothetical protein [candidate division KSB1 bacterium]